ncbi:hypothetical protein A6574_14545 [Escherichia coli]|nr:hypothetical protein A8F92_02495 [Escherichia coli]RCP65693.1 hypothetical protein A6574_14545 [Escherichia coli]
MAKLTIMIVIMLIYVQRSFPLVLFDIWSFLVGHTSLAGIAKSRFVLCGFLPAYINLYLSFTLIL